MLKLLVSLISIVLVLTAGAAQCSVLWDESVNGDLPYYANLRNLGVLATGSNVVSGTIGLMLSSDPQDAASFTVAPGQLLYAVVLGHYDHSIYWDGAPLTLFRAGEPIAYWNFDSNGEGVDLLRDSTDAPGPLQAGTYSFELQHIQQVPYVLETSSYSIDFYVEPVPEPSCFFVTSSLLVALGAAVRMRRRG